jgi:multisubunit Na+/H+ antiporter MnhF subunit
MMQQTMTILAADAAGADAAVETAAARASAWSVALVDVAVTVGLVVIGVAMLLCVYRLVRGPHVADRALAVDTLGVQLIGLVVLLMIRFNTPFFVDGILVLSLLGFAGTVAMAQYIGRPHLRRRDASADGASASPGDQR